MVGALFLAPVPVGLFSCCQPPVDVFSFKMNILSIKESDLRFYHGNYRENPRGQKNKKSG
jgi:hypothetical protein